MRLLCLFFKCRPAKLHVPHFVWHCKRCGGQNLGWRQ